MSENHVPAGADDFLPVLIYVTIKANPSQLQSNLKFVQLYRRQAKLISEPAYYFTNLVSTKEFIVDLNASSLSIDEITFEESMQAAKSISKVRSESSSASKVSQLDESQHSLSKEMYQKHEDSGVMVHGSNYPYLEAKTGELTVRDVDRLLGLYKDVVTKYTSLCKAISFLSTSEREPLLRHLEGVHPYMDLLSSHTQNKQK
ncbi:hypothetical protein L6164_023597 [Bauhinia variegata]|uniref:Uncharacterized protein n=1 Tax=Bauhinia variegata TaxID=167791 RepID=A0ACB9MJA1_BAUVA|nr:hypothetical protein L6164_023597 [Bauhinia variegata]